MDDRGGVEQREAGRPKSSALLADRPEVERDLRIARSLGKTLGQFDRLPEDERDYWIALDERERRTCSSCGKPIEQCSDAARKNYPYRQICYATMEREAAQRAYEALHEKRPYHDGTFANWAKERSKYHPYHFRDGVRVGVADLDLTPWDRFMVAEDASPYPSDEDEVDEGGVGEDPYDD